MHATTTVLENNHVKLVVEVDEEEIGRAEEDALRRLKPVLPDRASARLCDGFRL